MKIEPGGLLNDFLERNRRQYVIPVYQRNYEWSAEQCNKLFDDIVAAHLADKPHFCGSVVYSSLKSENKIDYYVIIDGQQRMTTIYILIKALLDCAETGKEKEALSETLINKDKFKTFNVDEASKLKLKPIKSDNNQLLLLMSGKINEMDKGSGVYRNYMLFKDRIKAFLLQNPDMDTTNIYDGIDRLTCAMIKLEDDDDNAQEIFERINSTGVPLSLADKIRNFVLMTDEEQERLYEEYWLNIESLVSKDDMPSFFIEYLNLCVDRFVKEIDAYERFKKFFKDQEFSNEEILREMAHYAFFYNVFQKGNDKYSSEINRHLKGLKQLKQNTVHLFLYRVFDDLENEIITEAEAEKVLKLLHVYSLRRIACEISSNSLSGLYKSLYTRVYGKKENKDHYYDALASFITQLTSQDVMPTDSEFAAALRSNNLYRKHALCKYLLVSLENQGKEKLITDNLSIEHIMPQNKNMPESWKEMLGDEWMLVHDKYLHTLGNLTLTGYNSEYSDSSFAKKKQLMAELGSHVNFLYTDVLDKEVWNEATIVERADRLAKESVRLFSMDPISNKVTFEDNRYEKYTAENPTAATSKDVVAYEFLGERVNVVSFVEVVESLCSKLYSINPRIIDDMIDSGETVNGTTKTLFVYEEDEGRFGTIEGTNIKIRRGFSGKVCISIIKSMLQKYGYDVTNDFIYYARNTISKSDVHSWIHNWCQRMNEAGSIIYDANNSTKKLIRFTTPYLDSVLPQGSAEKCYWKTPNYYFYEITLNRDNVHLNIQLYFYSETASNETRDAFIKMLKLLGYEKLNKQFTRAFKSSFVSVDEINTQDAANQILDKLLEEVRDFEGMVSEKGM